MWVTFDRLCRPCLAIFLFFGCDDVLTGFHSKVEATCWAFNFEDGGRVVIVSKVADEKLALALIKLL